MPIKSNYTDQDVPAVYGKDITFLQLPFANLRLSWHNGNPHADKAGGAKHFGGWMRGSDDVSDDLHSLKMDAPAGLLLSEWVSDKGSTYQAFGTRNVYAAPIAARDDWWEEFDAKRNKNVKRHRLDFLVMLGVYNQAAKVIEPYAPTTLSATGFAASAILKAFRAFEKDTAEARNVHAPGVPVMFFYAPVGTFGDKRIVEPAGQESSYVPCQYMRRDEWSEANLALLYVGDDTASQMLVWRHSVEEWLKDTHANRAKEYTEAPVTTIEDVNFALAEGDQQQDPFSA